MISKSNTVIIGLLQGRGAEEIQVVKVAQLISVPDNCTGGTGGGAGEHLQTHLIFRGISWGAVRHRPGTVLKSISRIVKTRAMVISVKAVAGGAYGGIHH